MSIKSKLDLIINNSTNHSSDIISNQLMSNLAIEDIKYFLEFNKDYSTLVSFIMNICSWEVFESMYNITLTEILFDNYELQLLYSMIDLLITNNKIREMYIIIIEKFTNQHVTKNSFNILIYSLYLTMIHCNYDHYIWKNSLYIILKKLVNIRKSNKPSIYNSNNGIINNDSSTINNDDREQLEYNEIDCYYKIAIHWIKKCIVHIIQNDNGGNNQSTNDKDELKNMVVQVNDLMIGFLLNFIVKCILPHTNEDQWNQYYGHIIIELVSKLLHGDITLLFNEIYRVQYDMFMQEVRYFSLKKYNEVYRNRFSTYSSTTDGDSTCTHGLSAEDANALLNRIAQSEYSTLLIQYYNSVALIDQQSHDSNIKNIPWISCIPWKHLLDYKKDREKDLRHDPDLCWHLKGIAILAKLLLSYILDTTGLQSHTHSAAYTTIYHEQTTTSLFYPDVFSSISKEINLVIPRVYQLPYLRSLLYPYVFQLFASNSNNQMRNKDRININQHGLEFLILLKLPGGCDNRMSIGKSSSSFVAHHQFSAIVSNTIRNNESSIFMPFLLQTDSQGNLSSTDTICAMNMSHIWLSFYSALPIVASRSAVDVMINNTKNPSIPYISARRSYWRSTEAVILASISVYSHDTLFLIQSLINAMALCENSQLRTHAFQTLREILKGFEERSLFGLLSVLINHCPYSNIAGLLIDIVRECTQIASRSHTSLKAATTTSWCTLNYSIPKISFVTNRAELNTNTATNNLSEVPFWLYECIISPNDKTMKLSNETNAKSFHFPHEKLFKPTTYNIPTVLPIDIDDIALVPTCRYDPPSKYIDDQHLIPDKYIDLKANMRDFVSPEKQLELNEAGPFIWHGHSPFWSPLVISSFVIKPIKDTLQLKTSEQILAKIDIISATINLIKFIVLKLRAESSIFDKNISCNGDTIDFKTTAATMNNNNNTISAFNSYFSGTILPKQYHLQDNQISYIHNQYLVAYTYPYTFNKLHYIREIFQVYHMICQLKINNHNILIDMQKHYCLIGESEKMDLLRIELLYGNICHLYIEYKILCKDIYSLLIT